MSAESRAAQAVLSIETLVYYGLKQQPFAAEAPDAFIYSDAALDMAVNATANYLDNNEHGIVVKGEPGIGKSTQIRRLLQRLRGRFNTCVLAATVTTTLAEIEHRMVECWHPQEAASQTEEGWLCNLLTRGLRPVLVIDDAHQLSADVLEELFRMQRQIRERCGRAFGLVLFGESSIEHQLSAIEADVPEAAGCHSILLRPLTREQIAAYIDHRLRTAGLFMDNPFTDQDIAQIHEDTQGIPAAINPAATRILEAHGQAEIQRERAGQQGWLKQHRMAVILGALTLLLTAGLLWLLQGYIEEDSGLPPPPAETRRAHQPLEVPPPPSLARASEETVKPAPGQTPQAPAAASPAPTLPTQATERPSAPASPADRTRAGQAETAAPLPETRPEPAPVQTPRVSARKTREAATGAAGEQRADRDAPSAPKPKQPAVPTPPVPDKPPAARRPLVRSIAGLKPPAWLLQQDPKAFAIQLVAVSEPAGLARIARELRIDRTLAWYHRTRNGSTLYVLVATPYASRSEARQAIARLPASLRRSGPWVRPLKDIQDIIYAQ
ncbi:MAG: hypothetical protein D6717_04830 [Gammaproteobacteria bacterium]|nr:MAG: hypothetical protein D6717_04830 [Gammaproteobacteria bacterium]